MDQSIIKLENSNDALIHQASFTNKLSNLDSNELKSLLANEYSKFNLKTGREQKNKEEVILELQLLIEELSDYKWMTQDQLKLIFAKALKGEFGDEVIYFSIANFHKWAKRFYQEVQRVEMKAIEASRKEETKEIPTKEQLLQQAILTANNYVDQIKKAKEQNREYLFPFGGLHILYDYLSEFGIIKLTIDQKKDYIAKASTNDKLPLEAIQQMAKGQAYKDFIYNLVDFDLKISETGELI